MLKCFVYNMQQFNNEFIRAVILISAPVCFIADISVSRILVNLLIDAPLIQMYAHLITETQHGMLNTGS